MRGTLQCCRVTLCYEFNLTMWRRCSGKQR